MLGRLRRLLGGWAIDLAWLDDSRDVWGLPEDEVA